MGGGVGTSAIGNHHGCALEIYVDHQVPIDLSIRIM